MSKSEDSTFPKKWTKVLEDMPEFKETAESSAPEELKKIIVSCAGNISAAEKSRDEDEELLKAKEHVKELAAPWSEAIKCQMAKIKYAVYLLESKGIEVGDSVENK